MEETIIKLKKVLAFLNYPLEEQYQRVVDFITIVRLRFVEDLLAKLSVDERKDLQEKYTNLRDINEIINLFTELYKSKYSEKELRDNYNQLSIDLFEDYFQTIRSACSKDEKQELDRLYQ